MLIYEFLKALSLAHQCLPAEDKDNKVNTYQGPSPDENALVEMAKYHEFEFVDGSE